MSFPSIQMKGSGLALTPEITGLIEHKLSSLGKFIPERATDATCAVEIQKTAEHQSGKIFRAEVNLFMLGKLYRAEGTEEQIEKAIDEMRSDLKRELTRDHEKHDSLLKRGGRKIKEMLRSE